jgi:hypothetical protein
LLLERQYNLHLRSSGIGNALDEHVVFSPFFRPATLGSTACSTLLVSLELLLDKHSNNVSVSPRVSFSISCSVRSLLETRASIGEEDRLGGVGGLGVLIRRNLLGCGDILGDLPLLRGAFFFPEFASNLGGDGSLGLCGLDVEHLAFLFGGF